MESEEAAPGHDVDDPAPKGKGHQKVIDPEQVLTKQVRSIRVPMTTPAIEDAEDEVRVRDGSYGKERWRACVCVCVSSHVGSDPFSVCVCVFELSCRV